MRVLLISVLVLFIGIASLLVISFPQLKGLSGCLEIANSDINDNYQTAKAERWSKELVCKNGQIVVEELQYCYKDRGQGFIPISIIESAGKLINPGATTLSQSIDTHNAACIDFPPYQVKKH